MAKSKPSGGKGTVRNIARPGGPQKIPSKSVGGASPKVARPGGNQKA